MQTFETPNDLARRVGETIGVSDWLKVDQAMIDLFAEATGDRQWIHVDVERAAREMPNGKTIAHGYLVVSLLPRLFSTVYVIRHRSRAVNYGSNKVRFVSPVEEGRRVRLHLVLKAADPVEGGFRFTFENTIELEGSQRPAAVAETLAIVYA